MHRQSSNQKCGNISVLKRSSLIELSQLIRLKLSASCLFVFVALHPMSTAMVTARRSVYLTTLFPGQA